MSRGRPHLERCSEVSLRLRERTLGEPRKSTLNVRVGVRRVLPNGGIEFGDRSAEVAQILVRGAERRMRGRRSRCVERAVLRDRGGFVRRRKIVLAERLFNQAAQPIDVPVATRRGEIVECRAVVARGEIRVGAAETRIG